MGQAGPLRAFLRALRRRLSHRRGAPARVRGREGRLPEAEDPPHQVLPGPQPRDSRLPLPPAGDGGYRGRLPQIRPGGHEGGQGRPPQQGHAPAHGGLCYHGDGKEQLHEGLLRLVHEDPEVRPRPRGSRTGNTSQGDLRPPASRPRASSITRAAGTGSRSTPSGTNRSGGSTP